MTYKDIYNETFQMLREQIGIDPTPEEVEEEILDFTEQMRQCVQDEELI